MSDIAKINQYWQTRSPAFSNQYNTFLGIPVSPLGFFLIERQRKIERLLRHFPGKILLDVGCGSGVFTQIGLKLGKYSIGIDYSKQMLNSAKSNLSGYDPKKYKLLFGDATRLPVKNSSVDILVASGLTDYLSPEKAQHFFKEIKRVLKSGGYAIITFPRSESPFSILRSGLGLNFRKWLLHLPPLETVYAKSDIESLCNLSKLSSFHWDTVMGTMWIVAGRKS